jgi:hypothetical protein
MYRCLAIVVFCTFSLGLSDRVEAVLVKNLSTGVNDATGLTLTPGTADSNWIIGSGGTGGLIGQVPIVPTTIPTTYLPESASTSSSWIAVNTGVAAEGIAANVGTFEFQTTVNLTGYDPATAYISSLSYAADNELINITVNGVSVYNEAAVDFTEQFHSFAALSPSLGAGLFQSGLNVIAFEVFNAPGFGSPNDLALRLEGSVVASVPEPVSIVDLIVLLTPALLLRRRTSAPPHDRLSLSSSPCPSKVVKIVPLVLP